MNLERLVVLLKMIEDSRWTRMKRWGGALFKPSAER